MGLFDIGKALLVALYDNSPTSPMMNDNARAGFENLKRQRQMEQRFGNAPLKVQSDSDDVAKAVLVGVGGAAVVGGAMLLKHFFSSDDKDGKNQTQPQNNIQPTNK